MRHLLSTFGGLIFSLPLLAQTFFVTAYHEANGLPADAVRQTVMDSTGYLWLATDGGLARFDGRDFQNFEGQLKSQYIKAFAADGGGRLHFVNDSGLYFLENKNGEVTVREAGAGGLEFPNNLFCDSRGRFWLSQPDGRAALFADGRITQFDLGKSETTGRSDSRFSFAEDRHGNFFLGSPTGGLFLFDEKGREFVLKKRLPAIHDLQADGDTLLVVGESLYFFDTKKNGGISQSLVVPTENFRLNCLQKDGLGHWYAGTDGTGIFRLKKEKGRLVWQKIFGSNDPHRVEELPFRTIHHLAFAPSPTDPAGQLWVSSSEGLGLLRTRFFDHLPGLANDNVSSISPGEKSVAVSFGTVVEIGMGREGFTTKAWPDIGRLTSLATTSGGFLAGTPQGEILRVSGGSVLRRHGLSERGGDIFSLLLDRGGSLWFCQAPTKQPITGVGRLLPTGQLEFFTEENGLPSHILVVKESPRGEIYLAGIGPETYLFRFRPKEGKFENLSLPMPFRASRNFEVHDMAIDQRGMVYLATTDGLLRHDSEHISRLDFGELTKDEFRSVIALENGDIWAATSIHGLVYSDENNFVHFDETSGLPTTITSYRSLATDADGRLWAGTAEGLVHSVSDSPVPAQSARPMLLEIVCGGNHIDLSKINTTELKSGGDLEISFIALAFPGDEILYQYKLQKITGNILDESEWSNPSHYNHIFSENMEAGKYELKIRAQQPGGHAWSEPLVWNFHLKQIWYKTWWAKTLMAAFALFIFWTYIRIYILKLIKRIRSLEKSLAAQAVELRIKENTLAKKERELSAQKEELAETSSGIKILHYLVERIPENTPWEAVIKTMANGLNEFNDIDAFEFATLIDGQMYYSGYSKKENTYTKRDKGFDDKASLTAWALVREKAILIRDFKNEHQKYVDEKDAYLYHSMIILPFKMKEGEQAVLNIYSTEKNAFTKREMMMLDILTKHVAIVAEGKL